MQTSTAMRPPFRPLLIPAAAAALLACLLVAAAPVEPAPGEPVRERILLDGGWRFTKGDPADSRGLQYDAWPAITDSTTDAPADVPAPAPAAAKRVLKAWILPTANPFIKDPAKHHQRPPGDPGGDVSYVLDDYDDSDWAAVTLPHDWAIGEPFIEAGPHGGMGRLPSWGVGWYRRGLDIPASDAGRSVFLDVEGAMAYASVWLNGRLVGGWPYAYNSWRLDLTPYLRPGQPNQLAMRLENLPASARWYPGGGLYRDVWLTKTAPVHVGHWGTTVRTPAVSAEEARIEIAVSVDNDSEAAVNVEVKTAIFALDAAGRQSGRALARIDHGVLDLAPGSSGRSSGSVTLEKPRLWGPPPGQVPHLHVAITTLQREGAVVDRYETTFGIRDVVFDPDHGVQVNGEPIPLQGVNNHHDLGALGAAFNRRAAERQLEILHEMGTNAIRMSHNPPAPGLLELTDRMGFLVIDEVFDVWQLKKTPLDFHLIFDDWHEADLRAMIRRDRNHPSVILWSVGNEVGEQQTGAAGAAIGRTLAGIAHDEDPTRPVTTAMNWADADMPLPATMDVINLNYQGVGVRTLPSDFPAYRRQFPDKLILSSESASALSSRGEFLFPVAGSTSGPVRPGVGGDPATRQRL
jgi:beta-galactosidase